MGEDNTTRRRFLRGAAAGTAGTLLVGAANASSGRAPRRIVGTSSKAAVDNAKGKAEAVGRTLDFGDIGQAVAGRFSDRAIEQLRKRRDVRYVETDDARAAGQTGRR